MLRHRIASRPLSSVLALGFCMLGFSSTTAFAGAADGSDTSKVIMPVRHDIPADGRSGGVIQDGPADPRAYDDAAAFSLPGQSENLAPAVNQYGIQYHNGPVMTAPIKIYYIWYGNWSGNTATTILTDLANSIGGSSHWAINSTYTNGSNTPVSTNITYGGSYQYTGTSGYTTSLSDSAIKSIVSNTITGGKLPKDANALYFVLTSQDVTASSGFCTKYCGWHNHATISGSDIKYSFVGNAARCISSCAAQSTSPNGNAGADAMASILIHEAEEAATDPDLNAWYDSSGYENADKCAWTFGTTSTASNGSKYNITLGARKYLIQQNWKNVAPSGACGMTYP